MASNEEKDYLRLLELETGASYSDIQRAYCCLALKFHPEASENQQDSSQFGKITDAYRALATDLDSDIKDSEKVFFSVFENVLLSHNNDIGVYAFFSCGGVLDFGRSNADDMYIEDEDDAGEKEFDKFVKIVQNSRKKGKPVPDGFTDEKLAQLKETLIEQREAHKQENSTKNTVAKIKPPNQVPIVKQKPKSKKQKAAEQKRREKEMEEIANEIAEKNKQEEEKAEKKKLAEIEKQRRAEEERARQASEDRKRREREEKERQEREKREREEEEIRKRVEEEKRQKEEKKKAAAAAKQKQIAEQKAKEEEKRKEAAAKQRQQQQSQQQQQATAAQARQYPPRELPPRLQKQQKQQQKMQTVPQGGQKTTADTFQDTSQEIGTWQNPDSEVSSATASLTASWGSNSSASIPTVNEIIVDSKDKEAWPSIGDHSETASDTGDDSASVQSGSVISNSSNPGQEPQGQGLSAIQLGPSASNWGANTMDNKIDSASAWGGSSSPGGANMNSGGWGQSSSPQAVNNSNQGHNMQVNPGDAATSSASGWGGQANPVSTPQAGEYGINSGAQPNASSANNSMWGATNAQRNPSDINVSQDKNAEIKGTSGWGTPVSSESGWGSLPPADPNATSASGWGSNSPASSPNPNTGTGEWGKPENQQLSQPSMWGGNQQGNAQQSSASSGWGNPSNPSPSPAGQWGRTNPSQAQGGYGSNWGASGQQQQNNPSGGWGASTAQQQSGSNWGAGKQNTPGGWDNSNSRDAQGQWGSSNSQQQGGWGSAPQQNSSQGWGNNPQGQWGSNPQQPPQQNNPHGQWGNNQGPPPVNGTTPQNNPQGQWGQAQPSSSQGWGNPQPSQQGNRGSWDSGSAPAGNVAWSSRPSGSGGGGTYATVAGKGLPPPKPLRTPEEEELLNKINSHDGWGSRPVNQSSQWDTQSAPATRKKHKEDENVWHQEINNGTAIWEESAKKSEKGDSSGGSVTSSRSNEPPGSKDWTANEQSTNSWNGPPNNDSNNWNGRPQKSEPNNWGAPPPQQRDSNQWGGPAKETPPQWGNGNPNDNWGNMPPPTTAKSWGGASTNGASQWGDSGNNPNNWGGPPPSSRGPAGWEPKENIKPSGWDDSTPPSGISRQQSRGGDQIDNGTAYWGDPGIQGKPKSWSSNPSTPNTPLTPNQPAFPPSRPKEDNQWGSQPNRNSGWGEPAPPKSMDDGNFWSSSQQKPSSSWGDNSSNQWMGAAGAKPKTSSSSWDDNMHWNPPGARKTSESSWNDDNSGNTWGDSVDIGEWNPEQENSSWNSAQGWTNKNGRRPMGMNNMMANKAIGAKFSSYNQYSNHPQMRSKMLQQLMEMGFKREDAQNALISNNMNFESAMADLFAGANMEKREESDLERKNRIQRQFSNLQQQDDSEAFVMQNTPGFSNAQAIGKQGNVVSSPNPSISHSHLQQKILNQMQQQQGLATSQGPAVRGQVPPGSGGGGGGSGNAGGNASQQVVHQQIVQQLRMAVQAGLINPQLLNQQLTPQMLVMLQHLLQLQNILQRFVTQQQMLQQNKGLNPVQQRQQMEQNAVMIQTIKKQIINQQQSIAQAQQALSRDPLFPHDISSLTIKDLPKSRLQDWKLPSPDKEVSGGGPDYDKAVGSKPIKESHSSPNLPGSFTSLSGDGGMWSTSLTSSSASSSSTTATSDWPSSSASAITSTTAPSLTSTKEDPNESQSTSTTQSSTVFSIDDMIPEFVPGKPWQGISNKKVEDDPHATPGGVPSSALSVNTIKISLPSKSSPSIVAPENTSTGWSTSSPPSVKDFSLSTASTAALSKPTWSSGSITPTSITSELWGAPMPKSSGAPSRPPPGLTNQKQAGSSMWQQTGFNRANSWAGGSANSAFTPVGSSSWERSSNVSVFLVLKNLTPQIDGSTLKTLCMQHGPLKYFYLSLQNGTAIVCYSTKEEAIKAQASLNTCVLGNTTIMAEFASESEIRRLVEQNQPVPGSSAGGNNSSMWSQPTTSRSYSTSSTSHNWNGTGLGHTGGMWSSGSTGGGLWGAPELDSNLIPGGLLGGDAM